MSSARLRMMAAMMASKPTPPQPVPYDAQVEYLYNGGTDAAASYIDTGIVCTGDLSVEIKFKCDTSTNKPIAGSITQVGNTYKRHHLSPYNPNNPVYWYDETSIAKSLNASLPHTVVIDAEQGKCYIDDSNYDITKFSTDLRANYALFARLSPTLAIQAKPSYIYYAKLSRGGVLLRDFIPVRVGQVGYMYDKVSGELFGNAGSGSFILGNDITT